MKKRVYSAVLCLLGIGAVAFSCPAQSLFPGLPVLKPAYVNNFCAGNALPQTCISDVMLDKKGQVWAATCQGMAGLNSVRLLRFDGYHFSPVNLANDSFPQPSLAIFKTLTPFGSVFGFLETSKINAVFLFDPERQVASTLPFDVEREGVINDAIWQPDGSMVAILTKMDSTILYRVTLPARKERLIGIKIGFEQTGFSSFEVSSFVSGNEVLVISNNPPGFYQAQLTEQRVWPVSFGGSLLFAPRPFVNESFNDYHYRGFVSASNGDLLCFIPQASPQVYVRRANERSFKPFDELPRGYLVHRMEPDTAGNILFLLSGPQSKYAALLRDPQGRFYDYTPLIGGHEVIHNVRSQHFLKSVFVAAEDGLFYKSIGYIHQIDYPISASGGIRGMVEVAPGQIWVTLQSQKPLIYNQITGVSKEVDPSSPLIKAFGSGICWKFMRDPQGGILTFRQDTLVRYDPVAQTHEDLGFSTRVGIYERLRDGRIVFCRREHSGLYFMDPATGAITEWKDHAKVMGKMQSFIHDIRQTKDGDLWVLTTNGLLRLNLQSGKTTVLGFKAPFRDSRFVCMAEAPDGKLWFGTFLGGIQIYDPANGSVKVVDKGQGLPSNTVVFILPDDQGRLLAGTYNGLSLLSAQGEVKSNFSRQEGLSEVEFNRFAALRTQNGAFFLGTVSGLHIMPRDFFHKTVTGDAEPQIFLTAVTVTDPATGGKRTYEADFDNLGLVVLPPENREIRLRFALSSYVQPDRNQFAYMLEGLDKHWTHIGSQHDLTLGSLPPGRYTLLITGCDFQGNCTLSPIRIPIHAREFFYKQTWFYLLCALPFAAFAFIWVRHLRSEKNRLEKEVQRRTRQIAKDKALIEQQARELLQLDEAKSRFFTNISHELRTPITLITAPVEHLIQKFHAGKGEDEERQSLQWVLYNGRKLAALVEELLELSRLEAGKTELLETPTDFCPWFRQLFSAFESQAQMKRIQYRLDYRANPELTLGIDRKRLEKIVNNLISNALKFTQPEGEVKVVVAEKTSGGSQQAMLCVQVSDTGRGIPAEDMPHLFERYFQTKRNDVARAGGTGIGLALAKELALLMKGDLSVESEWGRGSAFTLCIPLVQVLGTTGPFAFNGEQLEQINPTPEASMVSPIRPKARENGLDHLLVVEDNPDMQALLKSLLSGDYRLTIASDGQEAWDLLSAEAESVRDVSLILSDVMMPRMDGYELLGKIKSQETWRQKPVILLTARAEQDDKIQALQLGVDDYLVKPFSPPELLARVSNLVANYRSRQAYAGKTVPDISFEKVEAQDEVWLKNIETAAKHALDKGLSLQVGDLAAVGMVSERQFFREIKRLTGLTPNQYIQEVRLQKARHLLQHRAYNTLSEVAYAVGFDTPSYFTKVFEQHFGKHPSAYLEMAVLAG